MECFLQEIIRWRKVRQKESGFLKKDLHEKEIFSPTGAAGAIPIKESCRSAFGGRGGAVFGGGLCLLAEDGGQLHSGLFKDFTEGNPESVNQA